MVFSLFSDNVGTKKVAAGVPDELELGVPYLPDVEENTQLVDLFWPNSWTLFMLIKSGTSWLQNGPETWSEDPGYQETTTFVTTVKVTNDVAERGVKLITDYAGILTKDEAARKFLLQGWSSTGASFPTSKRIP